MAEHVQQIRNKKNDAHLLFQQPASQPWVVQDELLIAQAVLHCSGYVTHPNGCRAVQPACCTTVSAGTDLDRLLLLIYQIEVSDQYANAGPGRWRALLHAGMALEDGCRRWRMIQQLPWQPHPYQGGDQNREGGGLMTEREEMV